MLPQITCRRADFNSDCQISTLAVDDNDDPEMPPIWCAPDGWIFYDLCGNFGVDEDVAICPNCKMYFEIYKLESCGENGFVATQKSVYFEPITPEELDSIVKYHFGTGLYLCKAYNSFEKELEFTRFMELK